MKNKTKLGFIALLLIAVIFVAGCAGGIDEETEETDDLEIINEEVVDRIDFADAVLSGAGYRCEITGGPEEVEEMIIWTKDEKMRIESITSDGADFNQIMKDETSWVWSIENDFGMKISLVESDEAEAYDTDELDEDFEWNCYQKAVSDNRFEPPEDVEFMDLSDLGF